eukprot:CAMPEP_0195109528 /NCGR_PEP_ID=MMETSP0448-20130528/89714_1 /TAXON_ID=66468 /ORGANISM="Heterocapsa triquestra, Strain CCMP 448" /LENGTH=75 /DNA_ID=CAMNT_0040146151 /DNA_START=55 /DNA_END=279 /DNA_ORIENTATION=+
MASLGSPSSRVHHPGQDQAARPRAAERKAIDWKGKRSAYRMVQVPLQSSVGAFLQPQKYSLLVAPGMWTLGTKSA